MVSYVIPKEIHLGGIYYVYAHVFGISVAILVEILSCTNPNCGVYLYEIKPIAGDGTTLWTQKCNLLEARR